MPKTEKQLTKEIELIKHLEMMGLEMITGTLTPTSVSKTIKFVYEGKTYSLNITVNENELLV